MPRPTIGMRTMNLRRLASLFLACSLNLGHFTASTLLSAQLRVERNSPQSKDAKCVEHGFDARHFVRAEQIRFAQRSEHGEEGLGTTDFLSEILESMGQGVADGKAERAQSKGVQENRHLMLHAYSAVLKVAVIKSKIGRAHV